MVAIYFFFLKRNLFLSMVSNANFDKFESLLSWSNGLFVCALVLALISIIFGYCGLDKEAFLKLTETFKAYSGILDNESIKKLEDEFESKIRNSERFSLISMLLVIASIISAALAILIVILDHAEMSVLWGVVGGVIVSAIIGGCGYSRLATPEKPNAHNPSEEKQKK